jgi:hypothetical protein
MSDTNRKDEPFFIGFLSIPAGLRAFLAVCAVGLIAGFAALGWTIGAAQDDPGDGAFRFDWGRQTVTGIVYTQPAPHAYIVTGNERIPAGHTLMFTAGGKHSVLARAEKLEGQLATLSGVLLKRGDLDMMQVRGGQNGLQAADGETPALPVEQLGRWKLAGEICDGKCLAGAMRPGTGLAHKACANLCLVGDIPPVFVSTQAIEGSAYLLVAGPDGQRMPREWLDLTALYIEVEADVERRGDLLVMKIDPATIKKL